MYLKSKNQTLRPIFVLLFVLSLLLHAGMPLQANAEVPDKEAIALLEKFGSAMVNVADHVKPAVVNISTTRTIKTQRLPFFDDPFFRRFFGEGLNTPQKRKVTNLGSGVIATADGYIITNNHVIEGADDIIVRLSDNKETKGKVVGFDSRTDIAIVKINETNLPTITWTDSDKLRVGEVVLAVGNPYGLNQTITMGIISALGRSGMGITDYENFIQTDAAINPGNSGGALVNIKGEFIGINTAIFSTSGGYQGIGFAIPANMVKDVMDSIINQGKVVRGWLGVQVQPITADLMKQFGLTDEKGALVVEVMEGGPAEKGGLKRGDVILEFDGKKVDSPSGLKNAVASAKPKQAAAVRVLRDGNILTAKVTVGELPSETSIVASISVDNSMKGISVQELTEDYLQKLNMTKKIKGVVINNIEEDSPSLGILMKGDIIMEINRKPVTSVKEYNEVVSAIEKTRDILILIVRGGSSQYMTIPGK